MLERLSGYNELVRAVRKLVSSLDIYAVVLVGSRARGTMPWSDYDLVIIVNFKEKYLDRMGES